MRDDDDNTYLGVSNFGTRFHCCGGFGAPPPLPIREILLEHSQKGRQTAPSAFIDIGLFCYVKH